MRACWVVVTGAVVVLGLIVPAALAGSAPQEGSTVSRDVTTDPVTGLVVVTERTFRHGALIKVEIRTYAPGGRLLRKVEETFVNQKIATRETVALNSKGQIISKVKMAFDAAGRLVGFEERSVTYQHGERREVERVFRVVQGVLREVEREEVVTTFVNDRWIRIRRSYALRGGVLTLVSEERKVLSGSPGPADVGGDEDDDGDD